MNGRRRLYMVSTRWVVCRCCGRTDDRYQDPITMRVNTGTAVTMRCEDCAGSDGRATLCRDCCPTGHGTRYEPLKIGDRFDTPYEQGCTVTSLPDRDGNFLALDSEGVECQFDGRMILRRLPCR